MKLKFLCFHAPLVEHKSNLKVWLFADNGLMLIKQAITWTKDVETYSINCHQRDHIELILGSIISIGYYFIFGMPNLKTNRQSNI